MSLSADVAVHLPPSTLLALLEGRGIAAEYQPIMDVRQLTPIGYEALARFRCPQGQALRPDWVFQALHTSPLSLFQMEYRIKQHQIQYAPATQALFLNIDQDAFEVFLSEPTHPLVELIASAPQAVVEIIENSSVSDARLSIAMLKRFGKAGVPLALDDVGAEDSLVALDVLAGVRYIKLARDWLVRWQGGQAHHLLQHLIQFAHATEKQVILEGVETEQHLAWARELGIDYVQGFLFRSAFVQSPATI